MKKSRNIEEKGNGYIGSIWSTSIVIAFLLIALIGIVILYINYDTVFSKIPDHSESSPVAPNTFFFDQYIVGTTGDIEEMLSFESGIDENVTFTAARFPEGLTLHSDGLITGHVSANTEGIYKIAAKKGELIEYANLYLFFSGNYIYYREAENCIESASIESSIINSSKAGGDKYVRNLGGRSLSFNIQSSVPQSGMVLSFVYYVENDVTVNHENLKIFIGNNELNYSSASILKKNANGSFLPFTIDISSFNLSGTTTVKFEFDQSLSNLCFDKFFIFSNNQLA